MFPVGFGPWAVEWIALEVQKAMETPPAEPEEIQEQDGE